MSTTDRYLPLFALCEKLDPQSILEIGTNMGFSAVNMILNSNATRYVGFDLFEDATDETDDKEMNAKPRPVMDDVEALLKSYTKASVLLVKGDTNLTLPQFLKTGEKFDFAFIDGGHSVETIRNDWHYVRKMMKPDGSVVFDDYYHNREGVGCKEVIRDLPFTLSPVGFKVKKTGMIISMAVVQMKDLKEIECLGYL